MGSDLEPKSTRDGTLPYPVVSTMSEYKKDDRTIIQKGKDFICGGAATTLKSLYRQTCTYDGLIGNDVDYKSMFIPSIPFTRFKPKPPRFFAVDEELPLLLSILLGLQHALAMMGGLVSPSLIFASTANLETRDKEYLISAALIGAGFMTLLQVCRFRIPYTSYFVGTGMISVLGESFSTVSVFTSAVPQMYTSGFCKTDSDGTKLPCREAYGAFLGTGALCALLEVLLAFVPAKTMKKLFPPLVTGPVVLLVGAALTQSGMEDWAGGSGCYPDSLCNTQKPSRSYKWGDGRYVGIGFSVIVAIVLCDRFGAPIMKSCSVVVGLVVGSIIAGACGYFQHDSIDAAPSGEFNWVRTFPLKLYGPIVLPILAVYITCVMETIGDVTASADVSHLPTQGEEFESRIQGGVLASGLGSIIGNLATLTPLSSFAQNNGVISLTQVASVRAGVACCVWLVIFGCVGKWSATIGAMPSPVIGGMTTFLFASVGVSGLAIIAKSSFSRRDRVVLTLTLVFGFGSLLVPTWFEGVFTYKGHNSGKKGFIDAIIIVVETPYCIAGIVGCLANLLIPEQDEDIIDINVYMAEDPNAAQPRVEGIGGTSHFQGIVPAQDSLTVIDKNKTRGSQ
nr:YI31 [Starmerella bombicola]